MRQTPRSRSCDARRKTGVVPNPNVLDERVSAEYGLDYIAGNRLPHFSVTGTVFRFYDGAWRNIACGCVHDDIAAAHPALAELIAFHLWDQDGVPMHYTANADYWAQLHLGVSPWQKTTHHRRPFFEILADHVGAGVLGDTPTLAAQVALYGRHFAGTTGVTPPSPATAARVFAEWLDGRRPRLREAFLAAMSRHGCELIEVVDDEPTAV